MSKSVKSYVSNLILTISVPVFLITSGLVITETFSFCMEIFSDDFWRLLTTY